MRFYEFLDCGPEQHRSMYVPWIITLIVVSGPTVISICLEETSTDA
jgi:hypothetical protein